MEGLNMITKNNAKRLLKDINQYFIVDEEIKEKDFLIVLKNYIEVK